MSRLTARRWIWVAPFTIVLVIVAMRPAVAGYVQEPDPSGWAIPAYPKPFPLAGGPLDLAFEIVPEPQTCSFVLVAAASLIAPRRRRLTGRSCSPGT